MGALRQALSLCICAALLSSSIEPALAQVRQAAVVPAAAPAVPLAPFTGRTGLVMGLLPRPGAALSLPSVPGPLLPQVAPRAAAQVPAAVFAAPAALRPGARPRAGARAALAALGSQAVAESSRGSGGLRAALDGFYSGSLRAVPDESAPVAAAAPPAGVTLRSSRLDAAEGRRPQASPAGVPAARGPPLETAPAHAPQATPKSAQDRGASAPPAPEGAVRRLLAPVAAGVFLFPFTPVFHEFGHYLTARLFGRPARMRYNHVLITDADSLSYAQDIVVSAAGPVFNFMLGAALAAANLAFAMDPVLEGVFWAYSGINLFLGATNLIPLDGRAAAWASAGERGSRTDGWHIRRSWRARRAETRRGLSFEALAAVDRRKEVRAEEYSDLEARVSQTAGKPEDVALLLAQTRKVIELEGRFAALSPKELRGMTGILRRRLAAGESLDAVLPEAFAACREVMARVLGKRPYVEQVAAGVGVHLGRVLQQNTGEGKTLSIGLAAYLNALAGPVDVYTFNPYLALRDADEVGQTLSYLGLKTGVLQDRESAYLFAAGGGRERDPYEGRLARVSRRDAYRAADVLYGYNSAFVFDWLRDRDAAARSRQVMEGRAKRFAIVDEADAELLEEANTDYRIVSDEDDGADADYRYILGLVTGWKEGEDFRVEPRTGQAELTDRSRGHLAALRKLDPAFERWKHLELLARNALQAQRVLQLNRDYAVIGDEVVILDAHTGRLMWGRHWEAGLHRFVELKEGLDAKKDYRLSSHVALDRFMRMYGKLSGLTGTVGDSDAEFERVYGLKSLRLPPHRPSVRRDQPDRLYRTEAAKLEAVVQEALAARRAGRPVLIGARDLAESVRLAARLRELGESFQLLNGVQKEREQDIVDRAGRPGALTVATQLAGRGTDIRPDDQALASGGLHVVLTQKASSRRVDLQYRGRAARQGRPGSSVQFVSLEDELLARGALPEERAALEAALNERGDGMEAADPALAGILDRVQSRVEQGETAGRDGLRRHDAALDPLRAEYFALRAGVLGTGPLTPGSRGLGVRRRHLFALEPFGKRQALADLHSGWTSFVSEVEDLRMDEAGIPSEARLAGLFRDRVVAPFLAGRAPWPRLRGSLRQSAAAVRDFFTGSVFGRIGGWLDRRVRTPLLFRWNRSWSRFAARRGNAAAAAERAGRAVVLRPDARTYFDWAMAEFEAKDYDSAARGFIAALNLSWKDGIGTDPAATGLTRVAVENLAACLNNRAVARGKEGDVLGAAVNLRAAAELDGSSRRHKAWEDLRQGLTPEQAALAETPFPFLRNAYLYRGRQAVDEGRFAQAEQSFSRVLAINPDSATARFGRAFARNKLERASEAQEDLLEGLKGMLLGSRQFGNLRKIYPKLTGQTMDAGIVERAFAAFREGRPGAVPKPAPVSSAAREAAVKYWRAGRGLVEARRWSEALPYFDEALRRDPLLGQAYDDRGVARFNLEDYRGAFADMLASLRYETLGREGKIENLIAGHRTRITWTPDPGAVAAFFSRLGQLPGS